MRKIIALLLLLVAPSALADDMPLLGVSQGQNTGFIPPTCSNSLDFSQACNSQYIPAVL